MQTFTHNVVIKRKGEIVYSEPITVDYFTCVYQSAIKEYCEELVEEGDYEDDIMLEISVGDYPPRKYKTKSEEVITYSGKEIDSPKIHSISYYGQISDDIMKTLGVKCRVKAFSPRDIKLVVSGPYNKQEILNKYPDDINFVFEE